MKLCVPCPVQNIEIGRPLSFWCRDKIAEGCDDDSIYRKEVGFKMQLESSEVLGGTDYAILEISRFSFYSTKVTESNFYYTFI